MYADAEAMLSQALCFDPIYQQLLSDCLLAENQYSEIISRLSPQERDILERYIYVMRGNGTSQADTSYRNLRSNRFLKPITTPMHKSTSR